MVDPQSFPVTVGTHGTYEWLVTEHYLEDLLRLCPEIVLGKYIAVTSFDSGPLYLSDEKKATGWESRKGIAYSPRIDTVEKLPHDCWDEWYVFEDRVDLGQLASQDSNVFEASLTAGEVYTFVNFNFGLHLPEMESIAPYFWKQFEWIHPQTYIAESDYYLTIVSADKNLFAAARQALSGLDS
jgi:hypothetical protein